MKRLPRAFSLVELLVVTGVISVLASLLFPTMTRARERARRTTCLSNLRQLQLATTLYVSDYDGFFPARAGAQRWPSQLAPYYGHPQLLLCPTDRPVAVVTSSPHSADAAPRSYLLNGFQNPAVTNPDAENWSDYLNGASQGTIRETAVQHPDETILFGEKLPRSADYYADLHRGAGSFLEATDPGRHRQPGAASTSLLSAGGGANHAFADGSVRYLSNGKSTCPLNLWGVTDYYRTNFALCLF